MAEVAHRPERFAALTGHGLAASVTGEAIAALVMHPDGGLKGVPAGARVIPFLNQADTPERLTTARQIAQALLSEPRIHHVVIGALREPWPVREVHRRVRGIVLAAGSGDRMGTTKQLLPWGNTSVLGQTLRQLAASELYDSLVVTGHDAAAVATEAERHGVTSLHNPDYAEGEMLSSLQAAVRALPLTIGAVLVALADQPMVEPTVIDSLLAAYRQGFGRLIAPAFRGRRGNPVLIDRAFFPALLALPRGQAPRALLERFADAVHLVEAGSETVLQDLDTPADLARWAPQTRQPATDN
jgi:molybdenum cofactor cytidylyltransferase